MPEGNVEVVRGAYEAFGRGDIPAVIGITRDDVEWHVPSVLPQGMDTRGHDGVGQFFQRLGALWEDLRVETHDFATAEGRVAAIGTAEGKLRGEDAGYGFVHVWTLESGKVVRFQEYVDVERDGLSTG